MLTSSKGIDLKIRAGTVIDPGDFPPDDNAIGPSRFVVAHFEVGKNRMIANIFDPKGRILSDLTPQCNLPLLKRQMFQPFERRHLVLIFSPYKILFYSHE